MIYLLVFVIPAFIGAMLGLTIPILYGIFWISVAVLALGLAFALVELILPYVLVAGIIAWVAWSLYSGRYERRISFQSASSSREEDSKSPVSNGKAFPKSLEKAIRKQMCQLPLGKSEVIPEFGFRGGAYVKAVTPFRVALKETGLEREEIVERFRLSWLKERASDAQRLWLKAGLDQAEFDYWINDLGEFEVHRVSNEYRAFWLNEQLSTNSRAIFVPGSDISSYRYRLERFEVHPGIPTLRDPMMVCADEQDFRINWFREKRRTWALAWDLLGRDSGGLKFGIVRGRAVILLA